MAQSQDERIAKRASQGEARAERSDRPQTENREATDATRRAERLAILRDVNTKLPLIPPIPGYRTFWATTTNPSDSLEYRYRRGYTLVAPNELPGFTPQAQAGEGTSDRITCAEMVAMKIPEGLWLEAMTELHHNAPIEMAQSLQASVRIQEDGRGRKMAFTGGEFERGVSDGFESLNRSPAPRFVGVG